MAKAIYTNNAGGTLAANIGASDTQILLGAGQGAKFPTPTGGDYFYATLVHISTGAIEIVKCTARAADTLTVTRGQDSTTPIAFTTGSVIEVRLVAQGLRDLDYRAVLGVANGLATLDGTTRIPVVQMPTSVPIMDGSSKILDANIPDTIARDSEVALKYDKAGGTIAGQALINRGTNAADVVNDFGLQNGTSSLLFRARSSAGGTNPLLQAGDAFINFQVGAIDTGALVIGPWSASAKGLRIAADGSFTCNNNTVWHAGNFDPTSKLNVASPAFSGTGTGTTLNLTGTLRADGGFLYLNNASTRYVQWDNAAGWYKLPGGSGVEAVNFNGTSDRRLKANIVYRNADPYLADKLGLTDFLWKDSGLPGTGPIAQDVKRVAPQYVSNTGKHYAVNHAGLALEAVIGLADRVRKLEDKAETTCNSKPSKTSSPSCSASTSKAGKSRRSSK